MSGPEPSQLPLLCSWGGDRQETVDTPEGFLKVYAPGDLDPLAALKWAFERSRHGVVLIHAEAELPSFWWPRLMRAVELDPAADVVSALDPTVARLNPEPADNCPVQDSAVYHLANRSFFPQRAVSPNLSYWPRQPADLERLQSWTELAASNLRCLTCDHCLVRGKTTTAPGGVALDPLRKIIAETETGVLDAVTGYPGVDDLPVTLHILHSWGGGAARWVDDVAEAMSDRHHLVLIAEGDELGNDCGRELVLYAGSATGGCPVRRWTLPQSIQSTDIRHPEYRAVLAEIIGSWSVGQVIVSSLIGHSLDALHTGLPTLVVFHDYYPAWPRLEVNFESDSNAYDRTRLEREPPGSRLADLTPERWEALRAAYLEALRQPNLKLVAPDHSVVENLKRLDDRFAALEIEIVPHGHRSLPGGYRYATPRDRPRRRIIVPGRITRHKGKQLLLDALPELSEQADLYLLGSGSDGEDFFGLSGVHILLQYERDRLPDLLATIRPDFALLPSLTSETFSYTLSELWSLGVPVLAARVGALASRIEPGRTGWLFDPSPEALIEAIRRIDTADVIEISGNLRNLGLTSLDDAAADYRKLLPGAAPRPYRPRLADPRAFAGIEDARAIMRLKADTAELTAEIRSLKVELDKRGEWGFELDRRLAERTRWAKSLEADVEQARDRASELETELGERTDWALKLDAELTEANRTLGEVAGRLGELESQYQQVITSRSWRITRPLRFGARLVRRIFSPITGGFGRLRNMGRRGKQSLRVRGVQGTVRRVGQEFRGKSAPALKAAEAHLSDDFQPLVFPEVDAPRASIVIPVHNHFEHTYACLASLLEATNLLSFEVIVVDDASTDATAEELKRISGIRTLSNSSNLGFVGTCNRGAAEARGEFLVFLNNDTAVSDGWLDALLGAFAAHTDAGLVGARLVYPDGRLQEAGGIVFSDGSGWNYGRFEDPNHPAYNFVREVDYCSGAAIAIRRDLFDKLGGFDERYAPAYYEDTDLAFGVRASGKKVYYQPAAVITHFEGVTSGTDTSSGIKRYQVVNQEKFVAKWREALADQPEPGTPIPRAREHGRKRKALVIDAYTPEPDQDSGSVRLTNLMRLLRELGYQVTFCPDNRAYVEGYTDALTQAGVEVYYQPWADGGTRMLEEIGAELDIVLICRHYVASNYIKRVRTHCPNARLIFDTVDLHYLREERLAELENDAKLFETAADTRLAELDVARLSDLTLVVSPVEKQVLAQDAPDVEVGVVSNIHRVHGRRGDFGDRADLMFVGGYQHPPNIDAVRWFVKEIFPLVRTELPNVKLHVIGSKAPPEVRRLGEVEGVEFHGHVPDIEPYFDGCRLAVAPLRYGAGVKGKVNSSMSYGQPVVATPTAVEGMNVTSGEEIMVAETAEAFAAAVVQVYTDEALWTRLSDASLRNVKTYFSFTAAKASLGELLARDR